MRKPPETGKPFSSFAAKRAAQAACTKPLFQFVGPHSYEETSVAKAQTARSHLPLCKRDRKRLAMLAEFPKRMSAVVTRKVADFIFLTTDAGEELYVHMTVLNLHDDSAKAVLGSRIDCEVDSPRQGPRPYVTYVYSIEDPQ